MIIMRTCLTLMLKWKQSLQFRKTQNNLLRLHK